MYSEVVNRFRGNLVLCYTIHCNSMLRYDLRIVTWICMVWARSLPYAVHHDAARSMQCSAVQFPAR